MYKHVPNAVTLARFPLGALFVYFHCTGRPTIGLLLAILGCITDWADGYLARKWQCTSEFGSLVDPYADKFTCWALTAVILLEYGLTVPAFVYAPVVLTMLCYDAGLAVIRFVYGRKEIKTNTYAKRKTTFLMTSLLLLYVDVIAGTPLRGVLTCIGIILGWIAMWYALRAAHAYLQGYKMEWVIPYYVRAML